MDILVYSYNSFIRKFLTLKFKSLKMKLMINKYKTIRKQYDHIRGIQKL